MPIIYEVPTHLNVKDSIVFGLGAHQLLRVALGGSVGYGVWDQVSFLPAEVRLFIAAVLAAVGVTCALLQPAGRPLDQWALAAVAYRLSPRHFTWRHTEHTHDEPEAERSDWAELDANAGWSIRPPSGGADDWRSA